MPANTLLYLWPQRTFYLGELDGAVHLQLAAAAAIACEPAACCCQWVKKW